MIGYAINYYNDFVKKTKKYMIANDNHKNLLNQIKKRLITSSPDMSAEEIQNQIYTIGMDAGYENLRDFFKELYEILLGSPQGPRLGSFIKLYGIEETIKLIDSKSI
jgi:lysyl-tRNA synthetase class 1